MTTARISRLAEQDSRVSIASASVHCTIRDGRNAWTADELQDLGDIERRLNEHLDRLRERMRVELEAANQERHPQQPGGTA